MTISQHLQEFAGLKVVEYDAESRLSAPQAQAYRLNIDYEAAESGEKFSDLLGRFVDDPGAADVTALLIGCWQDVATGTDAAEVVEALVAARDRLPRLRALFLGEITYDESEISWIQQTDVSPLLTAFPLLEELAIRGGQGLSLGRPRHDRLKKLVIESGGLSGSVVREIGSAVLPALEHLELWLGDEGYGNDVTEEDLAPLLTGRLFPKLRYLGLRDDCRADTTAALLATSPVLDSLEVLDLSLGALGDDGADALLAGGKLSKLKKLDLHHHYLSEPMMARLSMLTAEVDLSDVKEPDDWDGEEHRYIAVAE